MEGNAALFAVFGLAPTALSMLAAVCGVRLGLCALHGQLLYFLALLGYSLVPLSLNSLWLIPLGACGLFCCGFIFAFFSLRRGLNEVEGWGRSALTALLLLCNFALLLFMLHNLLDIMCLRLNGSSAGGAVWVLKAAGALLPAWMLLFCFLGLRRLGLAAFYAGLGLYFGAYQLFNALALPLAARMPERLALALALRQAPLYRAPPPGAAPDEASWIALASAALACGLLGSLLLEGGGVKGKKTPRRGAGLLWAVYRRALDRAAPAQARQKPGRLRRGNRFKA